jgi:hypothetical protein
MLTIFSSYSRASCTFPFQGSCSAVPDRYFDAKDPPGFSCHFQLRESINTLSLLIPV